MAINIDMHRFQVPAVPGGAAAHNENILRTGNVHHIITHINNAIATDQQKMEALLNCLSQTLSSEGKCRGKCESLLKEVLFDAAKANHSEAQLAIQNHDFQNDSKLKEIIKKIHYLSAGFFGYHHSTLNYLRKFGHHFNETLIKNNHSGFSSLALGTGMVLVSGLQTALEADPNKENTVKKTEGWATTVIGGGFVAAPFIYIFGKSFGDEP